MRRPPGRRNPQVVTIRLLAPAGPVFSGRLATVSARLRVADHGALATWRWDDGAQDHQPIASGGFVRTRRSHRYAAAGVYRVRVELGDSREDGADRFVTVADPRQVAASGWVRDVERGERVAFGFLIVPGGGPGRPHQLQLRALLGATELVTSNIEWLLTSQPGSLHFGGLASIGDSAADHPYRCDVLRVATTIGRDAQRLTLSVYEPGAVPGRDSPMHRVSGVVRPGHVALGPFGEG